MKQWVKTIRDLAWYKIFVVLVVLLSAINTVLIAPTNFEEAWNIFSFSLFFLAPLAGLLTLSVKKPLVFNFVLAGFVALFFYMTEFYFDEDIDFALPNQTGSVLYSQKSEMSLIEANYYYYRSLEFQNSDGSSIEVKMEPNMDHETNIVVSWSNGVVRFQDKYDTAWIDTRNMCGNAVGNLEATLPEKKCQEDFSLITDWQDLGTISDKSSDRLVLVK